MARRTNGAADLRKFGGMRGADATAMVPLAELQAPSVTLHAADDGNVHEIVVRRFKSGQVAMSCGCPDSTTQGWCRHRLDALCGRFGGIRGWDATTETAFRRIVGGTLMEGDAVKLDILLKDFDSSMKTFDAGRPAGIAGDDLSIFTELVSDLAAAAAELEDAVGRMRRRFEVGETLMGHHRSAAAAA